MRQELIFNLNKLADELEEKAKAYRAVANDLNGQAVEQKPRKKVGRPRKVEQKFTMKGHKYNGKHWMQRPENRARMLKRIKAMHKARNGK